MTQAETVFKSDIATKSRIARGSHNKKTHAGKSGCHLPSDNLTAAALKKLNGAVVTYNLNKPMTRDAFFSMPLDLQKEYIALLRQRYSARDAWINDMLGYTSKGRFAKYCERVGIPTSCYSRGGRVRSEDLDAWQQFLNQNATEDAPAPAPTPAPTPTLTQVKEETAEEKPLQTTGTWDDLFRIAKALSEQYGLHIRIEVTS